MKNKTINVGDLVRCLSYGKIGVVTEVEEEFVERIKEEDCKPVRWVPVWVKWRGNVDWEIVYEDDLEVLSRVKNKTLDFSD